MNYTHNPVMLNKSIESLNVINDGVYVDCTFGRGGHSKHILEKIGSNGKLIAIDKDEDAEKHAQDYFINDSRFIFVRSNFSNIESIVEKYIPEKKVNGILLDLGVSSPQLENAERGFSFMKAGPLDMRMDRTTIMTALIWMQEAELQDISRVLKLYGEERYSNKIAEAIKKAVSENLLKTTTDLSELIKKCYPKKERYKKNPATKSFQAIRIYINNELKELEKVLEDSLKLITEGGRLVVISFHSLEDRIVKNFINKNSMIKNIPSKLPVRNLNIKLNFKKINIALKASDEEIAENKRARSARLRVAEKI